MSHTALYDYSAGVRYTVVRFYLFSSYETSCQLACSMGLVINFGSYRLTQALGLTSCEFVTGDIPRCCSRTDVNSILLHSAVLGFNQCYFWSQR